MKLPNIKTLLILMLSAFLVACSPEAPADDLNQKEDFDIEAIEEVQDDVDEEDVVDEVESDEVDQVDESNKESKVEGLEVDTENYRLIEVDGGDTSGYRESNVVVNIGHGDREYWAYTNEHGQLVRVTAKEIIVQNDAVEDVNSDGRYYSRMADVPGVGADTGYDRGHVIADSLGGVANAYNITPQDATLNRHGDQAYMEKVIRDAGGATDFEATITYPNTKTQIPSKYKYTYTIKGNTIVDEFENGNPDKINEDLGLTKPKKEKDAVKNNPPAGNKGDNVGNVKAGDVSAVDTNGNGKVTIQEAKDAGFKMPIYKGHWLYEYMDDRDGDGVVGE